MKDQITRSFIDLWEHTRYDKITVTMICQNTPVSRTAFYRHFTCKEDIIYYLAQQDFEKNCLPIFRFHLKEQGTTCFFSYIRNNGSFYRKVYSIDGGRHLYKCLKTAYQFAYERRAEYSLNVSKKSNLFDPAIFFEYSCSGIAGVVVRWIRDGMKIPDKQMGRDLYIMMSEPLSVVRDYYS